MGRARPFDDLYSWLHFLAAAASVLLGVETPATLAYIFYQYVEREKLSRKLGDAIEWIAGLFAGAALKLLLHWWCCL